MSPTERKLYAILSGGDWVDWSTLTASFHRNGWWMRKLSRMREAGIVERRAETLTDNRESGWFYDLRQSLGFPPNDDQGWNYLWSYRLKRHEPSKLGVAGSIPAAVAKPLTSDEGTSAAEARLMTSEKQP